MKNLEKFGGIYLKDFVLLDKLFDIYIFVYFLKENGKVEFVYCFVEIFIFDESNKSMKFNLYGFYFSFVKDVDKFFKCYVCSWCDVSFFMLFKLECYEKFCEV